MHPLDITNVTIAAGGDLPSGLFVDFNAGAGAGGAGQQEIYGEPDTAATTEDFVLQAVTDACVPAADIRVRVEVLRKLNNSPTNPGSNDNQTVCNNTVIPNISYTIGNALDADVVGITHRFGWKLPGSKYFVISGNVNVAGLTETTSYTYTITTTNNPGGPLVGPCTETSITGVITVRPEESLTLSPANGLEIQEVCYGEDIDSNCDKGSGR